MSDYHACTRQSTLFRLGGAAEIEDGAKSALEARLVHSVVLLSDGEPRNFYDAFTLPYLSVCAVFYELYGRLLYLMLMLHLTIDFHGE